MMPSPRLFRSRWAALLWAGGVIWTAVDIASANSPPAPAAKSTPATTLDAVGDTVQAADLATIANAVSN